MKYNKINNLLGWLCFTIASLTYIATLEPSVSFWDCGEFIACAYRLQVAHQPGYPLFAMLGKAFSLLSMGNNAKVPYFTNMGSALASGATIMFLFWTITALAKRLFAAGEEQMERGQLILTMGAGLVGALAFAYTDTFWFSAVETIVFAWSALCTALVFWAILKWDAHADEPGADKWIVFIAYVIGLSIGIHLLNLLTIPALVLVYYFRRYKNITVKNGLIAFLVSIAILGFVQYGIRGYTVEAAAYADLFFTNTLRLGFGSGVIVFFIVLIGALVWGVRYSIRNKKPMMNLAFLCVIFIYFGYGSFVYIPIRATAGTNLDNYHPDNAFALYGYLNRIQYPESPLLYGPYFDAKITDEKDGSIIYRKGKTQYEPATKTQDYVYDHATILPRMFSTDPQDIQFYRQWLQLPDGQAPAFADNMKFMFSWQMYQMYWRYFMWNFAGRYSDDDLEGQTNMYGIGGNWTTGLLDGFKHLPKSITTSNTYTPLYALPLILGLMGLAYHVKRRRKDALIVGLLFFFTGLAIVLYVNQPSVQPRERDYSYVGSFYAFAIWIGLGVIALANLAQKRLNAQYAAIGAIAICALAGPVLLASKEWKDHDRSTKWTAHDMAYNYLISCPKNAILFDYGDNDTYSLWYDQEVENIRPDVRIVNLSLLGADWSVKQMQRKINDADSLPITMPFEKYELGVRDVIPYNDAKIPGAVEVKDVFDFLTSDDRRTQVQYDNGTISNYLPTKNFKLTINKDDVLKNNVIAPNQVSMLTDTMKWRFTPNYVTKENLAMLDILAHNNWKRPICFVTSIPAEQMVGLQPYLYKEGFAYHLIPFKTDPTISNQREAKTNSLVMYNNVVNKFKWGNYKNAKYLDQQSLALFYPQLLNTFDDLTLGLMKDGHNDLALKALHKFNDVLPDLTPHLGAAQSKISLADTSYKLNYLALGDKLINSVDSYLADQLDYNYHVLQANGDVDTRTVQVGLSFLNSMAGITRDNHQQELSGKLIAQLTDYENKFGSIMNRQVN